MKMSLGADRSLTAMQPMLLFLLCFLWAPYACRGSVIVGDRVLSNDSWSYLRKSVDCWTAPEGMWVHRPDVPPLYTKVYSNDDHLTTKVYSECGPLKKRVGLDYVWTPPSSCPTPIRKFSFERMCKVMRGRHLIFTGDSLSLHSYETMLNVLGNRTVYGHQSDHHHPHHWAQPYNCETPGYGRNFSVIYLSWNNIANRHHFSSLSHLVEETKGAVLVANWGAFVLGDEIVKAHMLEIFSFINTKITNLTFIFRSSNMAHLNCDNYRLPDNILHPPAPHSYKRSWHWEVFPKQGVIWKHHMETHEVGKVFLDILPLSSKRPDQHPFQQYDCLHYCIPGPMDTWILLIQSTLQLIEELAEKGPDESEANLATQGVEDGGAGRESRGKEGGGVQPSNQQSTSTAVADADTAKVNTQKQIQELEDKISELSQALAEEKKKRKKQNDGESNPLG